MEQRHPTVSVIIPAYNAERFIRQTVVSVLEQTYPGRVEILVVDDASADGTESVVRDIMSELDKKDGGSNRTLYYYENAENKGVAWTRNSGVQQAGGDYVAFLDADDWWTPDKLDKQVRIMEQKKVSFCFTGRELMDRDGNSLQKSIPIPERVTFHDMLKTNYVTCSSVLLERECALAYPMDHDEFCEDYICWMRILKEKGEAVGINEPLVKYRMIKGSKSNDKKKAASNHYHSLRTLGLSPVRAGFCMVSYAYHGIKKYS